MRFRYVFPFSGGYFDTFWRPWRHSTSYISKMLNIWSQYCLYRSEKLTRVDFKPKILIVWGFIWGLGFPPLCRFCHITHFPKTSGAYFIPYFKPPKMTFSWSLHIQELNKAQKPVAAILSTNTSISTRSKALFCRTPLRMDISKSHFPRTLN